VLRDEAEQRERMAVTDADGVFRLSSLNEGLYRVEVTLSGYGSALVEHVPLRQSEITHARVSLRIDPTVFVTMGVIALEPPPATNNSLTTTFTQEFLNRVP
jgi:N-methylhydantoinase A/oxoprolinase/acetone carboxylase beta subunit